MSGILGNGIGVGQMQAFQYAPAAGATTISGADINGLTLTYTAGYIFVYVNGILQPPTDYTATNGSTIVFGTAFSLGDTVNVVALFRFAAADQLAKSQNGADILNKSLFAGNAAVQAQGDYAGMTNGTLVASASAGALTVAVKTFAGADPSATDPVYFFFRDNTPSAGDFTRIAVTAALSVVLGSTKTLGASSSTGVRVWITAHNNAGTVQLGAINCSDTSGIFCPIEGARYITAVPGNSSKTFYSTSAIGTTVPWRFLGYCEWASLTTAGTWVAPDIVQLFGPGVKKPGDVVQTVYFATNSITSSTSTSFATTTLLASISPSSAANLVKYGASGNLFNNVTNNKAWVYVARGSTAISQTAAGGGNATGAFNAVSAFLTGVDKPNTTSSTTYNTYLASQTGGNQVNFPYGTDSNTANVCGQMVLEELMG